MSWFLNGKLNVGRCPLSAIYSAGVDVFQSICLPCDYAYTMQRLEGADCAGTYMAAPAMFPFYFTAGMRQLCRQMGGAISAADRPYIRGRQL